MIGIVLVSAGLVATAALVACSSRVAGPESRCEGDAAQTIDLTAAMCAGAGPTSAPSASSNPAPPAPSADAPPVEAPAGTTPPAPAASAPQLDPATCDIDCAKACGGVPDAVCKRVSEAEVECRIARPRYPGC